MGLRLSFFKTPKNRVFNYQPLYYDERKEDLQERIARAREETKSKDYVPGRNIRMNFRRNLYENKRRPGSPFNRITLDGRAHGCTLLHSPGLRTTFCIALVND